MNVMSSNFNFVNQKCWKRIHFDLLGWEITADRKIALDQLQDWADTRVWQWAFMLSAQNATRFSFRCFATDVEYASLISAGRLQEVTITPQLSAAFKADDISYVSSAGYDLLAPLADTVIEKELGGTTYTLLEGSLSIEAKQLLLAPPYDYQSHPCGWWHLTLKHDNLEVFVSDDFGEKTFVCLPSEQEARLVDVLKRISVHYELSNAIA